MVSDAPRYRRENTGILLFQFMFKGNYWQVSSITWSHEDLHISLKQR
jgi:hypothetical protein